MSTEEFPRKRIDLLVFKDIMNAIYSSQIPQDYVDEHHILVKLTTSDPFNFSIIFRNIETSEEKYNSGR